jgi:hypothetical protein
MTVIRRASPSFCHVLREDSELAEAIPAAERERAAAEYTMRELRVSPGPWTPPEPASGDGFGLLVLGGLLLRRTGVGERFGAELLGQGDLLRPWQEEDDALMLPQLRHDWSALQPVRLAVLDERMSDLLGRYPQLADRLVGRAVQRTRHMAITMAIVHHSRVDNRLQLLFWHLASRWGRVRGDGVAVPLRLTHSVLAELVAARRPTVTSALSDLSRRGLIKIVDDAWLLAGDPPADVADIRRIKLRSSG